MKICELKMKDTASMSAIVQALSLNGYTVQTAVKWKEFPQTGIEHFCVAVLENSTEKGGVSDA